MREAWHDAYVTVVMILAAVVILVGVFYDATGRGGELAYEHPDYPPLDLGPVSATDVALLRPPTALWGYNMQVTDEALERIAQAVRVRVVTFAFLQQWLGVLASQSAPDRRLAQPPGPDYPGDPAGQEDRPSAQPADSTVAQPDDSTLATEEPTR